MSAPKTVRDVINELEIVAHLDFVSAIFSNEFHNLHGPKMCGPRNENERLLLAVSSACDDARNAIIAYKRSLA